MFKTNGHLSQEELVRFADGELSAARAYRVRKHLVTCSACRSRELTLERITAELIHLCQLSADRQISSGAGPRACLKAQLNVVANSTPNPWFRQFAIISAAHSQAYLYFVLFIGALSVFAFFRQERIVRLPRESTYLETSPLPNGKLTPGAIRPVTLTEICPAQDEDLDPKVSPSIQTAVFQEYGMANAQAKDYQIDYLINPQLGGTSDIHNLWPQPYGSTVWNAHVKDALEYRLHKMVCDRQIDLASAQKDLATNWISAYRKYFHKSRPIEDTYMAQPRRQDSGLAIARHAVLANGGQIYARNKNSGGGLEVTITSRRSIL